ncbi:BRO family, N-terminal domain [Moraxella cuniculi DSM 21768]|uniref:BRO family, N-terminal domain n=1 Tax=Moraxella cuniculi DSM 21768 TaxID=1122245 RepID=A0A1N7DUS8_9GAMM|nr:Bro-N domain-containing protein [Moraxella cuniculi]OOS07420.1 phage antirepressor protein [Moraxella cuniculi]SIR79531.1 BRO family, N-terminal domain [Moraxella cuniculi DSM 21768]
MSEIKLFENSQIRSVWHNELEEWFFSIVDIILVLTGSSNPRRYWSDLKRKIQDDEGGVELYEKIVQLKFRSTDGKMYKTDATDMQGVFRIIQSIPSPKAEPLKMWLAEVGKERVDEIIDPELTIDRALETYLKKGHSKEWINQRLQAIQVRKELTDAWLEHGIEQGREFAILTNEITQAWSGMTTREYKDFKGLKKENLRDNISTTELVLNMLAEAATKDITQISHPQGLEENRQVAKRGGNVAKTARESLEKETGKPVITKQNAIDFAKLIEQLVQQNHKR